MQPQNADESSSSFSVSSGPPPATAGGGGSGDGTEPRSMASMDHGNGTRLDEVGRGLSGLQLGGQSAATAVSH